MFPEHPLVHLPWNVHCKQCKGDRFLNTTREVQQEGPSLCGGGGFSILKDLLVLLILLLVLLTLPKPTVAQDTQAYSLNTSGHCQTLSEEGGGSLYIPYILCFLYYLYM